MQHVLKNWRGHWEWTFHHWPRKVQSQTSSPSPTPPSPTPHKRLCANSQRSSACLLKLSLLSFKHTSAPSLTDSFASPSEKQTSKHKQQKLPSSISQLNQIFQQCFYYTSACLLPDVISTSFAHCWLGSPSRLARIFPCGAHALPPIL